MKHSNNLFVKRQLTGVGDKALPTLYIDSLVDFTTAEPDVAANQGLTYINTVAGNTSTTAQALLEGDVVVSTGQRWVSLDKYRSEGVIVVESSTGLSYRLLADGVTWQQLSLSLSTTYIDSSGGNIVEALPASTAAGGVRFYTNEDVTNTATLSVQSGETLNDVIDGTFLFSNYAAGTQFRADEVAGGWIVSIVGASTEVSPFVYIEGALLDHVTSDTDEDFEGIDLNSLVTETSTAGFGVDLANNVFGSGASISADGGLALPKGTYEVEFILDHPALSSSGSAGTVEDVGFFRAGFVQSSSFSNAETLAFGSATSSVIQGYDTGAPTGQIESSAVVQTIHVTDSSHNLYFGFRSAIDAAGVEDFVVRKIQVTEVSPQVVLAGMVTPESLDSLSVRNSASQSIAPTPPANIVFDTVEYSSGSPLISSGGANNGIQGLSVGKRYKIRAELEINASSNRNPIFALKATDGLGTETTLRTLNLNVGTGDGSTHRLITEVLYFTAIDNTEIWVDVLSAGGANSVSTVANECVLTVEEVPSSTVVMPDALAVEDVKVLLGSATGIASNSNVTISDTWGNLAASYDEVEFEFVTTAGTLNIRQTERVTTAGWVDSTRTVLNADDTTIVLRDMDVAGATANLFLSGTVTAGDVRVYGVKGQKSVINTADIQVSDQTASGSMKIGTELTQRGTGTAGTPIVFPTAFDTAPIMKLTTVGAPDRIVNCDNVTTTGFNALSWNTGTNTASSGETFYWEATGLKA